jgi:hypothetical protein
MTQGSIAANYAEVKENEGMPIFQGMVKWQPPARGGANRMSDLSAYREQLETLLRHTPNDAIQVALEPNDRVATIKNRFRRALRELDRDNVALRFRNLYSAEQEILRKQGQKPQPEKLLVTYAQTGERLSRRGRKRSTSAAAQA